MRIFQDLKINALKLVSNNKSMILGFLFIRVASTVGPGSPKGDKLTLGQLVNG